VVDDNSDNREIATYLLQDMYAEVDTACDGAEAVRSVLSARRAGFGHDLILMDMRMPVMDGYTATRELRAAGVDAPIVALTAHTMSGDAAKCREAGCDAYIGKPIIPDAFISTILRHLRPIPDSTPQSTGEVSSTYEVNNEVEIHSVGLSDDPRFAPLVRRYLADLPNTMSRLENAREIGDREILRHEIHRLAGTGTSYGFETITLEAQRCEAILREGLDLGELDAPLAKLVGTLREALAD
jgi:two-component system sensor kinase